MHVCILVDLDLFRRLRARGEARGADGITDHIYNRDDGDGPVEPPTRSKRAAG